ncbi:MAG TPA: hypothetical protein VG867_00955, partial [Rhizomicrobium sp.]|nr:hypothetical protein [Rhizomicrobium sp.]
MNNTPFRIGAALVLALFVASCTNDSKLKYCPGMTSVLDAVVVTQFKGGNGPDADSALYTAKIADVSGSCTFDKKGKTSSSDVDVRFTATRPVAGGAATYNVPYFIAVTQGARVVIKQLRRIAISFDDGQTTAEAEDDIDPVDLVTEGEKKPYDYQILVGFQL